MRIVRLATAVCVACLSVPLAVGAGDDQDEKKRREEELELALIEALLEKSAGAIRRKAVIAGLVGRLGRAADRVDLLRVSPRPLPEGSKVAKAFHGYEVLSEVRVEGKDDQREVAEFLGKTLHWNPGRMGDCFNPRHGLRVVSGGTSLEFLVCFSCWQVKVYDGGALAAHLPLGFTDKQHPIERLLAAGEKNGPGE